MHPRLFVPGDFDLLHRRVWPGREVADSAGNGRVREDLWGEAAIRHPDGPSYEFFKDLLPPLRYVNTAFKHYPIVLAAPLAPVKARWVSNGSGINLKADKPPMWKEAGTPVAFFVGEKGEPFGADAERLAGPVPASGPVACPSSRRRTPPAGSRTSKLAFASARGLLADYGAVFVRFSARDRQGPRGRPRRHRRQSSRPWTAPSKTTQGEHGPPARAGLDVGRRQGRVDRQRWATDATPVLVVFTKPAPSPAEAVPDSRSASGKLVSMSGRGLSSAGRGSTLPEPVVQNAWRALVVGKYLIAVGDRMHYSAGNAYDHLYEAECGDAVRSLLLFGHVADARKMIGPLLDFDRQATRFHVAGHKLQLLAHYYWVTRDAEYLTRREPKWEPVIDVHPREPQDRQRPVAEGQLRRRHRPAGLFAQLQRRLLARAARHGRGARRPRREGAGRRAAKEAGGVPQGDPRRGRRRASGAKEPSSSRWRCWPARSRTTR